MPASIRKATVDDFEAVARLNRQVQAWHAATYPGVFRPASADTLSAVAFGDLLAAPQMTVLVALDAGDVVGYLTARRIERADTPYTYGRRVLYIDQTGVDEASRRTGCGRSLIDAALNVAKERGIDRVELDTWAANGDALAFFESAGFRAHNIRLSIDLPPARDGPKSGEQQVPD